MWAIQEEGWIFKSCLAHRLDSFFQVAKIHHILTFKIDYWIQMWLFVYSVNGNWVKPIYLATNIRMSLNYGKNFTFSPKNPPVHPTVAGSRECVVVCVCCHVELKVHWFSGETPKDTTWTATAHSKQVFTGDWWHMHLLAPTASIELGQS